MSHLGVVAKLTAKEGQRDQLAAALQPLLEAVNDEPGTLVYLLYADDGAPDVLWFYERYEDRAALKAHGGSEAMKAAGAAMAPFLASPAEIHVLSFIGGKGQ